MQFPQPFSWVSNFNNEEILGLTSDSGYTAGVNSLLGSTNPQHEIFKINLEDGVQEKVATIQFPTVPGRLYRTLDFLYNPLSIKKNVKEVLVSFSSSESSAKCRKVNVYSFSIPQEYYDAETPIHGQKFFESKCFPASTTGDYRIHQSGGRIVLIEKKKWEKPTQQEIYLSIGDFVKLSVNSYGLSAKTISQLGSVQKISRTKVETVASGLRNPQGLAMVRLNGKNLLLETEHGPRGGDELNVIDKKNHGWPNFSYGTAYQPDDPNDVPRTEGSSGDSQLPLFSWLPSIAPSQLLQNSGPEFTQWWKASKKSSYDGDVLVSSLATESIFRCRIEDGVVRYVEQMQVGQRIRSFIQTPSGKIVIGSDSGKILYLQRSQTWNSEQGQLI